MIIVKNDQDLKTAMLHKIIIEHFYTNNCDPNNTKQYSVRLLSAPMPTPFFDLDDYNLILENTEDKNNENN
jgi:hypothetical protein